MTEKLDSRRVPFRDDLAAAHLRGRVASARFVDGEIHHVVAGRVAMWGKPDAGTPFISELVAGEGFTVYEDRDGWVWGQCGTDGYVGWTRAEALAEGPADPATHIVAALRSFVYDAPTMKRPPEDALPMAARVALSGEEENGFLRRSDGGWVFAGHLRPLGWRESDPVATAERLMGVPYLWGGRTPWGLDCSGLTQLALACAGIAAPRDSDMQRDEVGALMSRDGSGHTFRRGDLVFFPGHVGLMRNETALIHATAASMAVTVEPLPDVAARAGGILAVRRIPE